MLIKRRDFLQIATLTSASLLVPRFLNAMNLQSPAINRNKILVVIQLTGGNDGLNTIIPVNNDIYYRSRPSISIKKSESLKLTDDAGLNPNLPVLKQLYDEGNVCILNNVGYPNPNRSHFRSMDIWQTASESNQHLTTGWLGRYLDYKSKDDNLPTHILETDDILSLALKGKELQGIALRNPRKFYSKNQENFYNHISHTSHDHEHEVTEYLYKTLGKTIHSTNYILEKKNLNPSKFNYPNNAFGKDLQNIASLIRSDAHTTVYYLSIGSFDTHVRQNNRQKELFDQLNDGLKAFTDELKKIGRFNDVAIMTFSEFGRRVAENASAGTDHGTANNMFVISGALKEQGFLNDLPSLEDLQDGDLKFNMDFRNVYATFLQNWLNTPAPDILGKDFSTMSFI